MKDQPDPIIDPHGVDITELVLTDLRGRRVVGITTYGTTLQPHNGRDMLADAYAEALDLAQYLRGAIYERDGA